MARPGRVSCRRLPPTSPVSTFFSRDSHPNKGRQYAEIHRRRPARNPKTGHALLHGHPAERLRSGHEEGAEVPRQRRPAPRLPGHGADPRVRDHAEHDQDQGRLPGDRLRSPRPGAPFDRPGVHRGRPVHAPGRRGFHLRLTPQPWRDHREMPFRRGAAAGGAGVLDHGDLLRRRSPPRRGKGRCRICRGPRGRLHPLRSARRDLRTGERLQQGHGRFHARVLRPLRQHAEQRHRGRLRGHRRGRRAVQARSTGSPASSSPISGTAPPPAAPCGKR